VDNARTLDTPDAGESLAMSQQGVDERAGGVTGAWVHHQAGGLVDHQEILVLEEDIQRDGFGAEAKRLGGGNDEPDLLPGAHRGTGLGRVTTQENVSVGDQSLDAGARQPTLLGQEDVEALARVGGGDLVVLDLLGHGRVSGVRCQVSGVSRP
jgi:hypothetical protein